MKLKSYITIIALWLCAIGSSAFAGIPGYGYIVRQVVFDMPQSYDYSRYMNSMGTARSTAMGGAFTSLGADFSSMSINPAGLGMYRSTTELGFTTSLNFNSVTNDMKEVGKWKDTRTNVGLNNIAVVLNGYEGAGAVTSMTWGLGYNTLADFNYQSTVDAPAFEGHSIAKMLAYQLKGVPAGNINPSNSFWYNNLDFSEWAGGLAYLSGLIAPSPGSNPLNEYYHPAISNYASIAQFTNTVSSGKMGETAFSLGMNFTNVLYMGFTLGITTLSHDREVLYKETYTNNPGQDNTTPAEAMSLVQNIRTRGEGVNFKFGLIYRPIPEWRIGLAVHTPTFMNIETRYNANMNVYFIDGRVNRAFISPRYYKETFSTPTRLMVGTSYTIGNRGIIAVDYECTWYDGIKLSDTDYPINIQNDFKRDIKAHFKPGNSIRIGGEFRALPQIALRGGYAYSGGNLSEQVENGYLIPNLPMESESHTISAGLGFNLSPNFTVDLTYVFANMNYTVYDIFYAEDIGAEGTHEKPQEVMLGNVAMTHNRHSLMLSLGYRF